MLLTGVITRLAIQKPDVQMLSRSFHLKKAIKPLDARWRARNRLPENTNGFGPLTNMADYSFKDGRPTPYGVKQLIRINKQREYLTTIKKLTIEMDYAVERHARLEKEKVLEKKRKIESKLKPKGLTL